MNTTRTARRRLTGALLIVVAGLAIAPATGVAKATGAGTYTVIPKLVYPGEKPGGPFVGQLVRGQTFVVTRLTRAARGPRSTAGSARARSSDAPAHSSPAERGQRG